MFDKVLDTLLNRVALLVCFSFVSLGFLIILNILNLKGTVMQIEKALTNDRLCGSKVS